ncbi:MAG TPA: hypothetical protein IAD26_00215 [Candidatus Limenecus avicola]|uniref:Uncharacterized protein n=1 Tax=Candidatus Limenecus avicola TaxID=2840847 RepID=A0A9D1MYV1_9CLOT|nr:hypothetical protein [Clostridium sp.]HIU91533.1 hypothetical protein [Candidatus Limenecus avicola]
MVDNRSAGFFGIGGGFNFKSGDISGTAAKTADDRQSPGMDYFQQEMQEEGQQFAESQFVDRSAQLNATLNSLAMMNVANIIKKKKEEEARAKEKNNNKEEKQRILDEKIPLWEDYQDENEDFFYVD